jgi:hypothetical protein
VAAVAVGEGRARVLYRLPEQRRFGASGVPGLLTMGLAAVVLFVGGLAVGRATMTGVQDGGADPATTAAAPAEPAATAPAVTSAPATAADGAAADAARVGPRRFAHGVGVGYARSQDGAVAAAANYSTVLSSTLILDDARRRAAIDTLAAPEARRRLQRAFDQAVASIKAGLGMTGAAGDGTQVLLRASPVGWRVEEYGGSTAKVAIWMTSVGGSLGGAQGAVPVREAWGTTTVHLRWVQGDWKQLASATRDGPVPIADVAPPTAAAELIDQADDFKEFTYAPGS